MKQTNQDVTSRQEVKTPAEEIIKKLADRHLIVGNLRGTFNDEQTSYFTVTSRRITQSEDTTHRSISLIEIELINELGKITWVNSTADEVVIFVKRMEHEV